jgi:hypothetical protein
VFDRTQPLLPKTLPHERGELGERVLRHRLEPSRLGGEDNAEGASVVGVALEGDKIWKPFALPPVPTTKASEIVLQVFSACEKND